MYDTATGIEKHPVDLPGVSVCMSRRSALQGRETPGLFYTAYGIMSSIQQIRRFSADLLLPGDRDNIFLHGRRSIDGE